MIENGEKDDGAINPGCFTRFGTQNTRGGPQANQSRCGNEPSYHSAILFSVSHLAKNLGYATVVRTYLIKKSGQLAPVKPGSYRVGK
jgi:hypothetical protein